MEYETGASKKEPARISLLLKARPERKLIRSTGSKRSIDFHIQVDYAPEEAEGQRSPLRLALVLDRSGSMTGEKIRTAKEAVLTVLDQLTSHDKVAIVVFDSYIDVIQPLASVTESLKSRMRETLRSIEARSNTALHRGWLNGCQALVGQDEASEAQAIARCFLLTDGIANEGVTDSERIASEAAGVREHTGISTSTFGIGNDYNELLLGPMAVAGGGQFHHLREPGEITRTFVGELGGLLAVVVQKVRLELEIEPGVNVDLVSAYWEQASAEKMNRRSIAIGDLGRNEERHVVARLSFPEQGEREQCVVCARLVWTAADGERYTDWQEIRFTYASHSACDDEPQDADVVRQVGLQEVDRARREAVRHNNKGDRPAAQASLAAAASAVAGYAGCDQVLHEELKQLHSLQKQIAFAPMAPAAAKEIYYKQQSRSRSQKDYRSGESATEQPEPIPPINPAEKKKIVDKKSRSKWPWQKD